jgi:hypothetical protein
MMENAKLENGGSEFEIRGRQIGIKIRDLRPVQSPKTFPSRNCHFRNLCTNSSSQHTEGEALQAYLRHVLFRTKFAKLVLSIV